MELLQNSGSNIFIILTVSIYFSALIYLGWRGFRKTKTFSDYILGSRKLGPIVGAMNVGASDMSSWLLMGLPGAFYVFGFNQIWMVVGLIFGSYCSWKFVAKRLRSYTEIAGDSLTLSSFLENRFQDQSKILSIVTSLVIIFFFTIYIASGFVGAAKLFSTVFAISYHQALIISCFAVVFYALLGGFLAVSWADLFQGILMLLVLILTPFFAIHQSNFSLAEIYQQISATSPQHLNAFFDLNFLGVVGFFAWGLGYFGQPHIITKYMAIKEIKTIDLARRICISWMSLSMFGAILIGIFGFVFFANLPLSQPETVFIAMANSLFHPLVIGILIAAILAATMSTINAQIIIACSALSQDFYHRFIRKKAGNKEMLFVTRMWVVMITAIAALIASDSNSSVLELVARAWAGLGASIGPVILFALFWPKVTKNAAVIGVISGALGAIIFHKMNFISYEILPAFALSTLLIFLVSLLTQSQVPSGVKADFEKLKKQIR